VVVVRRLSVAQLSESNVESVIGTLQSLVGYFDLDPNRVLDLVLEAYEHNQDNASYLRIIARFPRASLAHLTGFKFKYQYGAASEADPKGPRPAGLAQPSQSLYLLAARLIKHKFITIEDLYPHLQPEDSLAAEEYAKRFEKSSSSTTTSITTSTSTSAPAPGLLGIAPPGIVRLFDTTNDTTRHSTFFL
jgi:THO complex subunit 2